MWLENVHRGNDSKLWYCYKDIGHLHCNLNQPSANIIYLNAVVLLNKAIINTNKLLFVNNLI